MSECLVHGLAVANFRSIGSSLQYLAPLSGVHLLAGPNNAGKSNLLQALLRGVPALRNHEACALEPVDVPRASTTEFFTLAVGIPPDGLPSVDGWERSAMLHALSGEEFEGDGLVWFEQVADLGGAWHPSARQVDALAGNVRDAVRSRRSGHQPLGYVARALGLATGSDDQDATTVLSALIERFDITSTLPDIEKISAVRRIEPEAAEAALVHHGPGLLARLAALQHPGFEGERDLERFAAIHEFVRELFDDSSATLEVTHDTSMLMVRHERHRFPLESYGTGLHQVVIIAAAATVLENHLICVEEPEAHLHPTLQRKLIRYLEKHTSNQYLIATHSPHLLDAERASISGVTRVDGVTAVSRAVQPGEIAAISNGLGARASDLVQANAVIWVEGPSDRIYIRHWLKCLDKQLVEGIHYSIMFYGGALLAHLSPSDEPVERFVNLPRINRHFAVVIDSDLKDEDAKLNATKQHVKDEVDSAYESTVVWITEGYTIENYIEPARLRAAVHAVHKGTECTWAGDLRVNPLALDQLKTDRSSSVDKTAIAQAVVDAAPPDDKVWSDDLRAHVRELMALVRNANDLVAG